MATQHTTYKLNTGATIPAVGFGTWQDVDAQEQAVLAALKAGYRHIDTARIYGTEPAIGKAIRESKIPREELFITTKLWNNSHAPKDVEPALDASLKDLRVDYVDLYLMHWPSAFKSGDSLMPKDSNGKMLTEKTDYVDTYKAMEALLKTGKAKAIGISNFSKKELDRILNECDVVPAAHQFELHPWLQQNEFSKYNQSKGIIVTCYSPFGNQNEIYDKGKNMGKLMDEPVLVEIGKKYGKNGAQTALAWSIAKGHVVIPKSKSPERLAANLAGDFKLEPEEIKKIDGLDKKLRFNDPSKSFGYEFYTDLDGKKV
ncbi:Aldo/keto reductase [Stereum hirsutum FP-91666 SS1]|uniref:Aldo/keto reductase n=1 Tax=Stereum hirsutum (strain FP-91666) TaxID=721885 RepID=UPI000440B750|nr:Aldo/keto reductase [Stereum hirsutum FP-91666 SS1]EIM90686.1 Aldo/keto reductase [Stereum hirsutum FP-91666 SS1]